MNFCFVLVLNNQSDFLLTKIRDVLEFGIPLVVVDDGSDQENQEILKRIAFNESLVRVYYHQQERGFGAAMRTAFMFAHHLGYSHTIQIDASRQYNLDNVTRFIKGSQLNPDAIICGCVSDVGITRRRKYWRKLWNFGMSLETLSRGIRDGLCGFRVYPLKQIEPVLDNHFIDPGKGFTPEILVKAVWQGVPIKFVKTDEVKTVGARSKKQYIMEVGAMVRLHARIVRQMIPKLPRIFNSAFRR